MNIFHNFQCREGNFTYMAESRSEAETKALAAYLIRRIRDNPHVDTDTFAKWRSDFVGILAGAKYSKICQ